MKLVEHFNNFLRDTVNLNQNRIDRLEQRVATIDEFLRAGNYPPRMRRSTPQGSWAHRTIIKPLNGNDFDADLLVMVDEVENWDAADYVNELYRVFKESNRYKDMATLGTRGVELAYASEFHLDVVPCVQTISGDITNFKVCNRRENTFEPTASEAYTDWFAQKNDIVGNNMLRKVTRLIKYQRDVKETFSARSILLTTLLGSRIDTTDEFVRELHFGDLPTALKTIVGRLDAYLQANPFMAQVRNPVLPAEDFNRHWDQDKYGNFRNKIHLYRGWIDDAYQEAERDESIRKWRYVFGDEFAAGVDVERATAVAAEVLGEQYAGAARLVTAISAAFGAARQQLLERLPTSLPWVRRPRWPMATTKVPVSIQTFEHASEGGPLLRELHSGALVQPGRSIHFIAHISTGLPKLFRVKWQVVNTGEVAARAKGLRGEFYPSTDRVHRWEPTLYTGAHWVEAFVINTRTEECIGRSGRFFVVIE